jgi:hypothetical protein
MPCLIHSSRFDPHAIIDLSVRYAIKYNSGFKLGKDYIRKSKLQGSSNLGYSSYYGEQLMFDNERD